MEISISNFGPIISGNINTRPLTIFIGPNSSGKSYATMLLYSILKTEEKYINTDYMLSSSRYIFHNPREKNNLIHTEKILLKDIKYINILRDYVNSDINEVYMELSDDIQKKYIGAILNSVYEDDFTEMVINNFALELPSLRRNGNKRPKISIAHNNDFVISLITKKNKFIFNNDNSDNRDIFNCCNKIVIKNIKEENNNRYIIQCLDKNNDTIETENYSLRGNYLSKTKNSNVESNDKIIYFLLEIIDDLLKSIFNEKIKNAIDKNYIKNRHNYHFVQDKLHFLPSGRSGILEGRKAILAGAIKTISYAGVKDYEIPALKGIITDFITEFELELQYKRRITNGGKRISPLISIEAQHNLLDGELIIEEKKDKEKKSIYLDKNGVKINLDNLSSSYTELVPILLIAQYDLCEGDTIFIEEPEAHLHPDNIRHIAKFIIRLIRNKINVIVNTHSEYLLYQLSIFIKKYKLKDSNQENDINNLYSYKKNDYLRENEINVYCFCKNTRYGDYNIKPVKISDKGIEQKIFNDILNQLYEETNDINYAIQKVERYGSNR